MSKTKVKTYVGFLDVLGFSELISRGDEFEEIFDGYVATIRNIIESIDSGFTYTIFSDSIIIYGEDSELSSLSALTKIVSGIQYRLLLNNNVPIKGAISYGKLNHYDTNDGKDRVISGEPIVEAHRYEQLQNWIGVMLTPSVLRENKNLDELISTKASLFDDYVIKRIKENWDLVFSVHENRIPFKNEDEMDDNRFHGFSIVPHEINISDPSHVLEDLKKLQQKIRELKFEANTPSIQVKYQNTENYYYDLCKWTKRLQDKKWIETFRSKDDNGEYKIPERKNT